MFRFYASSLHFIFSSSLFHLKPKPLHDMMIMYYFNKIIFNVFTYKRMLITNKDLQILDF